MRFLGAINARCETSQLLKLLCCLDESRRGQLGPALDAIRPLALGAVYLPAPLHMSGKTVLITQSLLIRKAWPNKVGHLLFHYFLSQPKFE